MTMEQGGTAGLENSAASTGQQASGTQSPTPHTPASERAPERTFSQSEVTDIAKKVRKEAEDSFRRMQSDQPAYYESKFGTAQQNQTQAHSQPNLTEADFRRIALEEAQKLSDARVQETRAQHEADVAKRTVETFWSKLAPGKEAYEDFDAITGNIQWARFPNTVQLLANFTENAHDVAHDLGSNRSKLAWIESLAERSPDDAVLEVQRWAKSLQDNKAASSRKAPNAPLSQVRSSNTGTDDGAMTVSDYRRKYKV